MTQDELIVAVRAKLQQCAGWQSDDIQAARTDALNYYLQRPRGDEVNGRSTVVAGDISASVEANLAQMMDAYSSDNIIEFDPLDAEDEDAAQLESDAVVHFVMKTQNGYMELSAATKDTLLQRNGIIKVWVEDETQVQTRSFSNVDPAVVDVIAQAAGATVESFKDGRLTIKAKGSQQKFRAEAVAPENFFYLQMWESFDMQRIPFCAERHIEIRSELIKHGFPKAKVDRIRAYGGSNATRPDAQARDPGAIVAPATQNTDKSQDLIEWFECYALIDSDGDGIAERRCISFAWEDNEVLENESCTLVPYAVGAAIIMPHRITGISQYDKLRQTQDEHTGLKRSLYDNVNTVTKNRTAFLDGVVNSEDMSDGRTNNGIRVRADMGITDVRAAIMPFQIPDNSANILQNIEALKRERTELGGASLELASGQMQIGGDRMGSQGLDRAYSVMEQLAALMTKTLAATLIRNLFLLAHATLRENFTEPVPIKRNGKWYSPIPAAWPKRDRISVKIGMSPGERARRAQTLMTMLNSQMQLASQGMDEVLVNATGFYRTLMDWARVSDVPNPEQYFIDPESNQAQKAFASKAQSAQDAQQKREALMTQAIGLEQIRATIEKYTADQDTQFKYWNAVLQSQVEEAKIAGAATTELLKAQQIPNDTANGGNESTSDTATSKRPATKAA